MKATELRIGNFVTYNWSEEQPERPFMIRGIIESDKKEGVPEYNIHIGDGRVALPLALLDLIFPIKLTKEWLKKFGAKNTIDVYWIPIYNLKAEIHFEIYEKEIVCSIKSDFCNLILDPIKYVHELQNLYYSLTKEEFVLSATPINTKTL